MNNAALFWAALIGAGVFLATQKANARGNGMNRPQSTSESGRRFIKREEGLRLEAYNDAGDKATIGYGHLIGRNEPHLLTGSITREQAEELFRADIAQAEVAVNRNIASMIPLNQNEYDALVSFVYNVGGGNFADSTMLKKFNAGDKAGAADEFLRWVYITKPNGDKVVNFGLQGRRTRERALFLS